MDKHTPIIVRNYQEAAEICKSCEYGQEDAKLTILCNVCGCGLEARGHCIIYKWVIEANS